jgi:hypothetical protein
VADRKAKPKIAPPKPAPGDDGYSLPVESVDTLKNKPVTLGVVLLLGGLLFGCVTIVYEQLHEVETTLGKTKLDDEGRFGTLAIQLERLEGDLKLVRLEAARPNVAPAPAQAQPATASNPPPH